ncbi:MAG: DUF5677 domain-containing protein [Chloroflexota bacterium]
MLINCKKLADALQLFYDIVQALVGMKMSGEQNEILTGLLGRIYFLGTAIYQLGKGTEIPEIKSQPHFWDSTSMHVLIRALVETAAQLNYLFLEQVNDDEREYRICYFKLRGLLVRQGIAAKEPENQAKQQAERDIIENLKMRIVQTNRFKELNSKEQQRLLDGENSKRFEPSKTQLIKSFFSDTGASPDAIGAIYGFLSDYAHSGYVSALQTYDHTIQKESGNNALANTAIWVGMITYRIALCYSPAMEYLAKVGLSDFPAS